MQSEKVIREWYELARNAVNRCKPESEKWILYCGIASALGAVLDDPQMMPNFMQFMKEVKGVGKIITDVSSIHPDRN